MFSVSPDLLTYFEEPAFSVRVEEGVSEVIPIVLRDLEGLVANALVQFLETAVRERRKQNNLVKRWNNKQRSKYNTFRVWLLVINGLAACY